jgi:hypothetical protein
MTVAFIKNLAGFIIGENPAKQCNSIGYNLFSVRRPEALNNMLFLDGAAKIVQKHFVTP